jgi:hypothetical protein
MKVHFLYGFRLQDTFIVCAIIMTKKLKHFTIIQYSSPLFNRIRHSVEISPLNNGHHLTLPGPDTLTEVFRDFPQL